MILASDADEMEDTRPQAERCPRCNDTKHPENAVCDVCGDALGCACCGGTGTEPSGKPCPEECAP